MPRTRHPCPPTAALAAVLLLCTLALPAPAAEATPDPPVPLVLTLEDAIARALEHNLGLARGAIDIESHGLEADRAAESVRGMRITPAGAAETGPDSSLWRAGLGTSATLPWGTVVGAEATASQADTDGADPDRRTQIALSVSQPLFRRFGTLVRDEPAVLASEALRAARRAWERDRSALVLQVAESCESIACLARRLECDQAQALRLERLAALAAVRENRGDATRTEVLRLDLQRGEAESRIETDRAGLDIAEETFADLLGLPPGTPVAIVPPPPLELEDVPPARALDVALRSRPDYAQALDDIATADRQALLARRALLPDLALAARHVTYGDASDWSGASRLDETDWRIGLEGSMNLDIREARLSARKAATDAAGRRTAAEIVRRRLALDVHSAQTECHRARRERDLARRNLDLADRRAELARTLFEAGRGTADAVSDAEADALSARLRDLEAQRAASVASYRLLHVLGTLVPAPGDLLADLPDIPQEPAP